jgi:D-alanyl-D-alanine dipeptidase
MMNLEEKIERSKSNDKIDWSKYQSRNQGDPLVKLTSTDKVLVEPCWTIPNDFEGGMYADYIAEHSEYDGVYARSTLVEMLEKAASSLAEPCQLVIRAGHRPIDVQKRLLKECASDYKRDNPGVTDDEALQHARMYVSDPDITLPPHVCGAAFDVEIKNKTTGKCLDFGGTMNDDKEHSFLHYPDLSDEQKANRLILLTAMLDAGFASCKPEWWHYSYGDQIWAWFYGEEQSLYSPIDL